MADWVDSLAKVLPVEKVYDDAVAPFAKQVGKFGEDAGKAARLILSPIQGLARLQDRLEAMFERIGKRVPEERQIEVRPEISAPAIEAMTYLDDKSELWRVLEEILTKAADRDTVSLVHPAFVHIAKQMTPDEINTVFRLKRGPIEFIDTMELDQATNTFFNKQIIKDGFDVDLIAPTQFDLLTMHLTSLGLMQWPVYHQKPIPNKFGAGQAGVTRYSRMELTPLGNLFVDAATSGGPNSAEQAGD